MEIRLGQGIRKSGMNAAWTTRSLLVILCALLAPLFLSAQQSMIPAAKILFEERSFEKAQQLLLGIDKNDKDYAEALYYMGRIAVEKKKYDLSVEKFEAAIEANPKAVEYHNWLGVMYGVVAMNSGTLKQAYLAPKIKHEFETAADLDPKNIQTQWGLLTYYSKAPGFLGGSWEKAFASAAIIRQHDRVQGLRAIAFIHDAQNNTSEAEKEYQEAIRMDPENCESTFALAKFYSDHKKYDKAMRLYEGVLLKNPRNIVASYHLGFVSAQSGLETEKGIACLTKYLAYTPRPNEPGHSDANLGLAMIYEKKGDRNMARKYYQNTLGIYPAMKEAREGLERVEKM